MNWEAQVMGGQHYTIYRFHQNVAEMCSLENTKMIKNACCARKICTMEDMDSIEGLRPQKI